MAILDFFKKKETKETESAEQKKTISVKIEERGTSGTNINSGYYDEEYLYNLRGTERAKCFDKMDRSDAQVGMLLGAVKNPIKSSSQNILPASDDLEHTNHVAFIKKALFEDIDFDKFLEDALALPKYGHVVFEKVHKINVNKNVENEDGQVILTSYVGLKKLGWRSPKTIETWNFENGELKSIRQCADGDLSVDTVILAKHLMIMTIDGEGDDLEGISMLRRAYGNHFRKNHYLKLNAIGIEKSMPIPTAEVPVGQEESDQFDNLISSLENFTTHQKAYMTYPQGWTVSLSNGTSYNPQSVEASIDAEDRRMAKAFLANFLELGMGGGGGAFALSNDLSDFFLSGLVRIANIIKKSLDKLIQELIILNFGEQSKYPEFEFTGISDKAGEEFAKILDLLTKSKVIIPDDDLEDHARKRLKLPKRSQDGQREVETQKIQNQELTLSEKVSHAIREKRKAYKH